MVIKVIEWYESNREKVKEAEDALKDFELQDNIDDLNAAKDAELEALNSRIKNWDDYLSMLQSRYEEYDRLQQQKLLMELLGATSEEEVQAMIQSDMLAFTEYMSTHTNDFFNDQIAAFAAFNTTFAEYLEKYKQNLEALYEEETREVEVISADDYLALNDEYLDTDVSDYVEKKKKVTYDQTLYEIFQNDNSLLKNNETLNKLLSETGNAGTIDYSKSALANAISGDLQQAAYDLVLRQVKINGEASIGAAAMTQSQYGQTNAELIKAWTEAGYLTDVQAQQIVNGLESSQNLLVAINEYNNALLEEDAANTQNLIEIESDAAQFTMALATNLPWVIESTTAQQIMETLSAAGLVTTAVDDMGISFSDSFETESGKIVNSVDEIFKILREQFTEEEISDEDLRNAIIDTADDWNGEGGDYTSYDYSSAYGDNGGYTALDTSGSYIGGSSGGTSRVRSEASSGNTASAISAANAEIVKAQAEYAAATTDAGRQAAHDRAEAARATLGYSGGTDGSSYIATRANGIEGGPITYTGLAMLHGSSASPEYVLNNDQAYNLLRYMSTSKPEFESKINDNGNTIYDFGGVTINECNNAEEFFSELNKAMNSRYNITKHKI